MRERTLETQRVRHPKIQKLSKPGAPGNEVRCILGSRKSRVELLIEIFWEAKVAETHEGGFFTASIHEGSATRP
jgi:hypothetical protein